MRPCPIARLESPASGTVAGPGAQHRRRGQIRGLAAALKRSRIPHTPDTYATSHERCPLVNADPPAHTRSAFCTVWSPHATIPPRHTRTHTHVHLLPRPRTPAAVMPHARPVERATPHCSRRLRTSRAPPHVHRADAARYHDESGPRQSLLPIPANPFVLAACERRPPIRAQGICEAPVTCDRCYRQGLIGYMMGRPPGPVFSAEARQVLLQPLTEGAMRISALLRHCRRLHLLDRLQNECTVRCRRRGQHGVQKCPRPLGGLADGEQRGVEALQ